MHKTSQYLEDEHMQLYEWSGADAGATRGIPARSKRTHPWHASYGVLALTTSLLILSGCYNKGPAEQASDQAVEEMKRKGPLYEETAVNPTPAESPEAAGRAMDATPGEQPVGEPAADAPVQAPAQ